MSAKPVAAPAKPAEAGENPPRRSFMARALAVIIGGIVSLVPLAAGVAFFIDPLRKRKKRSKPGESPDDGPEGFVKVAQLDSLTVGVPQSFTVVDDRTDAWNLFPKEPLGGVYLLLEKNGDVLALNNQCPHVNCPVDYQPGNKVYQCPCHNSSFNIDGSIANPKSPAARGLDSLEVQKLNGQIWVKFERFQSGTPKKIPIE
ncbi:MAG: ubiquinol-cytochrome c reductase iron-sulfur subunit [Planctomycetales bacterium]